MDILLPNGISAKKIEKTNNLNVVSIKSNTKLQEEEARLDTELMNYHYKMVK